MSRKYRIIPLLIWSGIIFFGSTKGAVSVVPQQNIDILIHKMAHLGEYAVLYVLFIYAFYTSRKNFPTLAVIALIAVFLFGLSDEVHQLFTPTRGPKVSDAFVDLCGGVVGYSTVRIFLKKRSS